MAELRSRHGLAASSWMQSTRRRRTVPARVRFCESLESLPDKSSCVSVRSCSRTDVLSARRGTGTARLPRCWSSCNALCGAWHGLQVLPSEALLTPDSQEGG